MFIVKIQLQLDTEKKPSMILNINFDYDCLIGKGANYITSITLNGRKYIFHGRLGKCFLAAAHAKRLPAGFGECSISNLEYK